MSDLSKEGAAGSDGTDLRPSRVLRRAMMGPISPEP
jgi:hypothetical protein